MDSDFELKIRQGFLGIVTDVLSPNFKIYATLPEFFSKQDAVDKFMTGNESDPFNPMPRVLRLAVINLESIEEGELGCDDNPSVIVNYNCRLFVGYYGQITDNTSVASAYNEASAAAVALVSGVLKRDRKLTLPDFTEFDLELPQIRRLDTGLDELTGLAGASAEVSLRAEVWKN